MPLCTQVTATPKTHHYSACHHAHAPPSSHTGLHALHATNHSNHTLIHDNAFNPDTGKIAEYGTLFWSSDGAHWQAANIAEIHHLPQGTLASPGINIKFFIPVTALPVGHKATYLWIVCAHHPEKHCHTMFAGLWMVTGYSMTAMSAPKLPT